MFKYTNLYLKKIDYLKEGFPWPARPLNIENIFKHIFKKYGWNWCFILPVGPCGLARPPHIYINVATVEINMMVTCIYLYMIWYVYIYDMN